MKQFTKVPKNLLSSTIFNGSEKLFISHLLSFQENGEVCTDSNKTIADDCGISISTLKKMITKFNKEYYHIFNHKVVDKNSHELSINVAILDTFIAEMADGDIWHEVMNEMEQSGELAEMNKEFYERLDKVNKEFKRGKYKE